MDNYTTPAGVGALIQQHHCPTCERSAGEGCHGSPAHPLPPGFSVHVEWIGAALGARDRELDRARRVASDRLRESANPYAAAMRGEAERWRERARNLRWQYEQATVGRVDPAGRLRDGFRPLIAEADALEECARQIEALCEAEIWRRGRPSEGGCTAPCNRKRMPE